MHGDRIAAVYDGDAAGNKATLRSLDMLLEHGMEVRVVELQPGMAPKVPFVFCLPLLAYFSLKHWLGWNPLRKTRFLLSW